VSAHLTRARVEQVAIEIKQVARFARGIDPATKGHISYPSMCGGLQSVLRGLVHDTAGPAAAALIEAAFKAVHDTESDDAGEPARKAAGGEA